MASLRIYQQSNGACEVDINLTEFDVLPLHWDLTWRAKLKVCWLILCGRRFTMSGPMHFRVAAPPGSRVAR